MKAAAHTGARFRTDLSVSAVIAGFVTVLVGFTSSAVIVFQGAQTLGASAAEIASWMWALGIGMGVTCIALSLRYRVPIVTAWSTPGAAMLITSAAGIAMPEAIGAFLVSAVLITVTGFTGWFERAINRIPLSLASGMLAGVLLRFGLDVFIAMKSQFALAFTMFAVYLVARRVVPRYAVVAALAVGIAIAGGLGLLRVDGLHLELAQPVFTAPQFSLAAMIGVALPLFVVTMASQNVPGIATLRAAGYSTPASPLIAWTGVTTVLLAPFGGYAFNLAAITAAMCTGPEAHPDPTRRYVAAVAAGVGYCVLGILGSAVGALLGAVPRALVMVIAGLALLGTIGNSLAAGVRDELHREAAVITFLVTASGVTLAGIGSAFWGLAAGLVVRAILESSPDP